MSTKNVDELLFQAEQQQLDRNNPAPYVPSIEAVPVQQEAVKEDVLHGTSEEPTIESTTNETNNEKQEVAPKVESKTESDDKSIDEYGNPVEPPKTYTEEEVNRMMRERFSRGKWAEQSPQVQQQVQKDAENFKADPNSEDSWEIQLEAFIERTLEKRQQKQSEKQQKQSEKQWREQELVRQAEFEEKFNSGMIKYRDFRQVVDGKPITDAMMLATQTLENPAAFVYGAAKMHPGELERISRIADPYQQASEIGRLHEKMVKANKSLSNSPKPIETPRGDLPIKQVNQPSLEQRIDQYARQKRR